MSLKKIFFVVIFLSLSFFSVSIALAATNKTVENNKFKPICFTPQIPIPGFEIKANGACKAGQIAITHKGDAIALYVSALYRYAAGLAGVIAMFMIVFASWQWIMASGNAGKIDNAKDTIKGALLGLTLLFTGNLLLSNITDNLVNFEGLSLDSIETQYLQLESVDFEVCPNTIYIACGSVTTSTGARCVGSKCQANAECRTVVNGLPTRDFCNPDSVLPCTCVADDYEYPVEHVCSSFSGIGNADGCLNDSTATDGPCRWDTDFGYTCKNVLSGYCSNNSECKIDSSEDPNTSTYCCCNDSEPLDSCVLRSSCSSCN